MTAGRGIAFVAGAAVLFVVVGGIANGAAQGVGFENGVKNTYELLGPIGTGAAVVVLPLLVAWATS